MPVGAGREFAERLVDGPIVEDDPVSGGNRPGPVAAVPAVYEQRLLGIADDPQRLLHVFPGQHMGAQTIFPKTGPLDQLEIAVVAAQIQHALETVAGQLLKLRPSRLTGAVNLCSGIQRMEIVRKDIAGFQMQQLRQQTPRRPLKKGNIPYHPRMPHRFNVALSFCRLAGAISQSGSRYSGAMSFNSANAALTGMGLLSMKRSRNSG